jgi:hypothetical protein
VGAATPLIARVETPRYGEVVIEASDGKRYRADLSRFATVACYPKSDEAWRQVGVDGYGLALVWTSRFEVHVDQVIGLADRVESARRSA